MDGFHNPHKIIPAPGGIVPQPAIINHDYLVLEVGYGFSAATLFIRAEKRGYPVEKAGILLTVDSRSVIFHTRISTNNLPNVHLPLIEETISVLLTLKPSREPYI